MYYKYKKYKFLYQKNGGDGIRTVLGVDEESKEDDLDNLQETKDEEVPDLLGTPRSPRSPQYPQLPRLYRDGRTQNPIDFTGVISPIEYESISPTSTNMVDLRSTSPILPIDELSTSENNDNQINDDEQWETSTVEYSPYPDEQEQDVMGELTTPELELYFVDLIEGIGSAESLYLHSFLNERNYENVNDIDYQPIKNILNDFRLRIYDLMYRYLCEPSPFSLDLIEIINDDPFRVGVATQCYRLSEAWKKSIRIIDTSGLVLDESVLSELIFDNELDSVISRQITLLLWDLNDLPWMNNQ